MMAFTWSFPVSRACPCYQFFLVNLRAIFCFTGLFGARSSTAATFTVVNTLDAGPGSLRQAIADANANSDPDFIGFDIPTSDIGYDPGAGVWTIQLLSSLVVTHSVTIDGYTQPGSQPNTQAVGQGLNTVLRVVLHFLIWPEESAGLFRLFLPSRYDTKPGLQWLCWPTSGSLDRMWKYRERFCRQFFWNGCDWKRSAKRRLGSNLCQGRNKIGQSR